MAGACDISTKDAPEGASFSKLKGPLNSLLHISHQVMTVDANSVNMLGRRIIRRRGFYLERCSARVVDTEAILKQLGRSGFASVWPIRDVSYIIIGRPHMAFDAGSTTNRNGGPFVLTENDSEILFVGKLIHTWAR